MTRLENAQCIPCKKNSPGIGRAECEQLLVEIPGWKAIDEEGVRRLQKEFSTKNFATAMAFSNKISDAAESVDHHPSILTEWGKVIVTWWTHSIKGLHINDFIMAAKTDSLYAAEDIHNRSSKTP